jgi:hypothetical protein
LFTVQNYTCCLVEKSENLKPISTTPPKKKHYLSSSSLPPGLFVVHNSKRSGQHNVTELTRGQEVGSPSLDTIKRYIKTRADAASFVDASKQVDNNFTGTMVINNLELTNVA